VAQLKTEITINQIKAQREQRRKNKKQNNSLILHNYHTIFFAQWCIKSRKYVLNSIYVQAMSFSPHKFLKICYLKTILDKYIVSK